MFHGRSHGSHSEQEAAFIPLLVKVMRSRLQTDGPHTMIDWNNADECSSRLSVAFQAETPGVIGSSSDAQPARSQVWAGT